MSDVGVNPGTKAIDDGRWKEDHAQHAQRLEVAVSVLWRECEEKLDNIARALGDDVLGDVDSHTIHVIGCDVDHAWHFRDGLTPPAYDALEPRLDDDSRERLVAGILANSLEMRGRGARLAIKTVGRLWRRCDDVGCWLHAVVETHGWDHTVEVLETLVDQVAEQAEEPSEPLAIERPDAGNPETVSLREAEQITGIHRGTLSRWCARKPELVAKGGGMNLTKLLEAAMNHRRSKKVARRTAKTPHETVGVSHALDSGEGDLGNRICSYLHPLFEATREKIIEHIKRDTPEVSISEIDRVLSDQRRFRAENRSGQTFVRICID